MRLLPPTFVVVVCLAGSVLSGQQSVEPVSSVEDEILVKFRPHSDDGRREAALDRVGGRRIKRFRNLDIDHVRIPRGRRADDVVAEIQANADVIAAQPNYVRSIAALPPPNDFFWINDVPNNFWALKHIQTDLVWANYTQGDGSVVVAHTDTGVKYTHPDLAANMWVNPDEIAGNGIDDDLNGYIDDVHGINVVVGAVKGNPMDDNGHGTHTAGTFGAVGNNHIAGGTGTGLGTATVGVNWNVKILPCKFLDALGNGTDAGAIECFNYITALKKRGVNIRVSNNSWGGPRSTTLPFPQLLKDAIDAAGNAGIINIFAAGNGGGDGIGDNNDITPHDPASFDSPSIVSVAASNQTDVKTVSSNFGPTSVDLAAPGFSIISTFPGTNTNCLGSGCAYARMSGTSMAVPHVAGVAALLAAQSPSLPVSGIKSLLIENVTPLTNWADLVVSGGRLNAFNPFNALAANAAPSVSITSPAAATQYTAPTSVTIDAIAEDNVAVTSVDFFANGTLLASDTTVPYSISTVITPGTYLLTAKATDHLGASTTSAVVPIVINAPEVTRTEIRQTVTSGGTRLQQLQNTDGGWYLRPTDTSCFDSTASCPDITGINGLGLLSAYRRTNDPSLLADAVRAGQFLQALHAASPASQPHSQDLEFLRALSAAGAGDEYAALASTWFTTITDAHPVAADRVDDQFARRGSLAVWDLASLIRSAKAADDPDYATALAARIVAREADWKVGFPHSEIGLGSLLWAIHDLPGFSAQIGDYRALLLAAQDAQGSWGGNNLQITAYATLGLGAVGGAETTDAIERAVQFMLGHQLPELGWPFASVNGVPGEEFTPVDSEVTRAIDLLFSTGVGEDVTVSPAQLVTLTFERVRGAAGMTSVVATDRVANMRMPRGYTLVSGLNYEVITTARFTNDIIMCVTMPWDALENDFARLRLLQPRDGQFRDETIRGGPFGPDASAKRLCTEMDSLAPVSVAIRQGDSSGSGSGSSSGKGNGGSREQH